MTENSDIDRTANLNENDYKTGNPDLEPRDSGDQANDIRFSEEEQLIREQAQGIRAQKDNVPRDNSDVDKAMAGFEVPDADLNSDASDDPPFHGQEQ